MQLHCPYCGSQIPAEHVNLDNMVAKCASCSSVFRFDDQLGAAEAAPRTQLDVPLPKGIAVEHQGYELAIVRRWLSAKYFFLIFFCLFWDGFLLVWYTIAISQRIWIMALFATLHTAIGLFLTYYTLAGFFNRTQVRVSPSLLAVRHGPVPWWGNKQLDSTGIAQVYCKEHIRRSRGTTSASYSVHAALHAGGETKLVDDLDNADQALYLEQEVERFLGVKDVPVRGEMVR
jgi:hypothetical protein